VTDCDSEANMNTANHVREGRVEHPLQDPAPSNPGSLVRPGLLKLPHNGDIRDSHPFDGARDIVDEAHTYRVQFVGCAEIGNERNTIKTEEGSASAQ